MKPQNKIRAVSITLLITLPLVASAGAGPAGHSHHHEMTDATSEIGKAGRPQDVTREVVIEMKDSMNFSPSSLAVKQNETIKIIVRNTGKLRHELSLGTQKDLLEHLEMMKRFPMMEHDEPNSVTLEAGKQSQIIWKFSKAGVVDFACLIPGHFEAGMKGKFQVKPH